MIHDPLPWEQDDTEPRTIRDNYGWPILKAYVREKSHENSAFAAHAANNYHPLVSALKKTLVPLASGGHLQLLDEVQQVLKAAEKEEG